MKLTQEYLKSIIHYDPKNGIFTNKVKRGSRAIKGADSSGKTSNGYMRVRIGKRSYLSHRLAFLYMEGYFPEHDVDHINRIKTDNRWVNLRHVSRQCNLRNSRMLSTNSSGITGVSWMGSRGKWEVYLSLNNKKKSLGVFKNKIDAAKARWEGEKKYNFPNCNSTSTAYLYLKKHCPNFDENKK